jgi:hypothetical protein
MKEIRNTTSQPLRVPLPGGKTLHLGPGKVGEIADKAEEHPGLQKLVEEGSLEILGEGERHEGIGGQAAGPGQAQGHAKSPFRRRSGER